MNFIVIHTQWNKDETYTYDEIHLFSNEAAARNAAKQLATESFTYSVLITKVID